MNGKKRNIPDVLTCFGGEKIRTIEDWENFRREEIMDMFRTLVYGEEPFGAIKTRSIIGEESNKDGKRVKEIYLFMGEFSCEGRLYLPKGKTPCPVFLYLMLKDQTEKDVPLDHILERGFGAAFFSVDSIAPDDKEHWREGILQRLSVQTDRFSCGAIGLWAYGLSRMMDALEKDPDVRGDQVVVVGHSRGGKCALWAAANDPRFAMCIANNSGCTGAALQRNKGEECETIRKITERFPYWFCQNFSKYSDREEMLPVDQHMLIAAIAPRPVYITIATQDDWADPVGQAESCRLASEVYHLYGLDGLENREQIPETCYHEGNIGFHIRTGEHGLFPFDWECFMDYADKKFGRF